MTVTGAPGDLAPTTMFAALADDTRWRILTRLGEAPASASALARELPVSRQAIVKHLGVLEDAGLVEGERQGRSIHYALYDDHVAELLDQAVFHTEHLRLGGSDLRGA